MLWGARASAITRWKATRTCAEITRPVDVSASTVWLVMLVLPVVSLVGRRPDPGVRPLWEQGSGHGPRREDAARAHHG
jgi:hypothetical protein